MAREPARPTYAVCFVAFAVCLGHTANGRNPVVKEEEKGATLARDARSTSLLPSRSRFEIHRSWKSKEEAVSALPPRMRAHGLRGPRRPGRRRRRRRLLGERWAMR